MSDQPCNKAYRRRIDRVFTGEQKAEEWDALRTHLEGCEGCRAYFDRLEDINRALSGTLLSRSARDRIAQSVLPRQDSPSPVAAPRIPVWTRALAASAAGILAVVVVVLRFDSDTYRARGVEASFAARPPGITLFCITPPTEARAEASVRGTVRATARSEPLPRLRCSLGEELQIAYSTPSEGQLSLVVSGNAPKGARHWYVPSDGAETCPRLLVDAVDEPMDWSTRLEVSHQPARVRVVARFFEGVATGSSALSLDEVVFEVHAEIDVEPAPEGGR